MEPKPTLIPSLRRMYAFDSDEQIPILMNNITANATFYVINNKAHAGENLLGFKTLTDFNVVQIVVPYHMIPGTKDKLQELIDQKIIKRYLDLTYATG